jgi:hypothetical protein
MSHATAAMSRGLQRVLRRAAHPLTPARPRRATYRPPSDETFLRAMR